MYEKTFPNKRFKHTLEFLQKHISTSETIFDLGVLNPFSKIMEANGYTVKNTTGEDIDNNQTALQNEKYTVFTAFEIFEHLGNCTGKDKRYNYFNINIIDNYFFFYKEKFLYSSRNSTND